MGALSARRDAEDDERQWCPHCGGALGAARPLLQHPCFDEGGHCIVGAGGRTRCTPTEWRILNALREQPRRILRRSYLINLVPSKTRGEPDDYTVDVHLSRLRRKLGGSPFCLETMWGIGWILVPRDDP